MATQEIICDTDVIIDFLNSKNTRHKDVKSVLENKIGLRYVLFSAVTQMELMIGTRNKEDLQRLNKNIRSFRIVLIDQEISWTAIQLMQKYNLSHGLEIADAFIAATAVVSNLRLFTHNIKDYKFITTLQLFNP